MRLSAPLLVAGCGSLPQPVILDGSVDLVGHVREHAESVRARTVERGVVLLRGSAPVEPPAFRAIAEAIVGPLSMYTERTSPRTELHPEVYTSTDYPAHSPIFLHNENSYQTSWPSHLVLHCVRAATEGGETVITDGRRLTAALPPTILDRFDRLGWRYVRNFHDHIGLPWEEVFQTRDREVVEEHCARERIQCEWHGASLRLVATRPAFRRHPVTGEKLWFNHAAFFHPHSLPIRTRRALLNLFEPESLPSNSFYGDGTAISDSDIEAIVDAYLACSESLRWQAGDLLVLDNMLAAHGRQPFVGDRMVLVAMAGVTSPTRS